MWQDLLLGFFCFEQKELFVSLKLVVFDCGGKLFETFVITSCNLLCIIMNSRPLF